MDTDQEDKKLGPRARMLSRLTHPSQLKTLKAWRDRRDQNFRKINEVKGGGFYVGFENKRITSPQILKTLVPQYKNAGDFYLVPPELQDTLISVFTGLQILDWREALKRKEREEEKKTLDEIADSKGYHPLEFDVYQNVNNAEQYLSVRRVDERLIAAPDIDPKGLLEQRQLIDPDYCVRQAVLGYIPWGEIPKEVPVFRHETVERLEKFINVYRPPGWIEKGILSPEKAKMPDLFHRFFTHLFTDQKSREVVFAFLHRMLWGSNRVILILNGSKGVGKNFFADICKGLVGALNFKMAKRSILDTQFNSDLADCLCYYFDEIAVKHAGHVARLKQYANQLLPLEAKGKDARQVMTYKSMIMNNNSPSDLKCDYSDRRFTVPEITDLMLPIAWGNDAIDEFREFVEDLTGEHYRQLGSWLFYNADLDLIDKNYVHKGERFSQIVLAGLEPWQAFIRDRLLEVYQDPELLEEFKANGMLLDEIAEQYVPTGRTKSDWPKDTVSIQVFLDSFIEIDRKLGRLDTCLEEDEEGVERKLWRIYYPKQVSDRVLDMMEDLE